MPNCTVLSEKLMYLNTYWCLLCQRYVGQTTETPAEVGTRWQWEGVQIFKLFIHFASI